MRRLTSHLTYANVIATLALFVALGGSSYAAIHLGRNTVGSAQIKTGAVGSSEVRNHSLRASDLSGSARRSLRGQIGPAGPQGPAGTPAVSYYAAVAAGGSPYRGNFKGEDHSAGGSGRYTFTFERDVSACAYTASIGTIDGTATEPGLATVRNTTDGQVVVQTTDVAGNPKDLPFHLIVAC